MRVLPTVSLTNNQKRVLAKIVASPTPKVAGEEISGDQNLSTARDQLAELGAIEYVGGEAMLTPKGEQLAKDDNLVDDSGQLTPDGEQLAHTDTKGMEDKDMTMAPQQTPAPGVAGGETPPIGGTPGGDNLFMSGPYPSFKQFLESLGDAPWEDPRPRRLKMRRRVKPVMAKPQPVRVPPEEDEEFNPAKRWN